MQCCEVVALHVGVGGCALQVMQEELKKLGLKVNHHEANITFLKSEINAIEESIADLTSKIFVCLPPRLYAL